MDLNGNESPFAALGPNQTTAVGDAAPVAFALERMPNPSFGGRLSVSFSLPCGAPATLELVDVSGRRVAVPEVDATAPGRYTVEMSGERRFSAGIYFVRLTQGKRFASIRAIVL